MNEPRRNAADPEQVKSAGRVERRRVLLYDEALAAVLQTFEGRLVCWELLSRCGVFRSIWRPNAEIHYYAGRQDFGHEVMADLIRANEAGYLQMEAEARDRARRAAHEINTTAAARATTDPEGDQPS